MKSLLALIVAAIFAPCGTATFQETASAVERVVVPHVAEPDLEVEIYWTAPREGGPWPAILYVHGHQRGDEKPGARLYADRGYLQEAADRGLFAAAVSQPGYGESDGPPDFCGPRSQGAVESALAWLRAHADVRADRVVLSGYSRGSVVAAMVATRDTELCGVILGAGTYDVGEWYANMGDGPFDKGIRANIRKEAGVTEAAFRARSALLADPPIGVPTLILHGDEDENCPPDQARKLADRLLAAGTPVTLAMFPGVGHSISSQLSREHEDRFLAETAFAPNGE